MGTNSERLVLRDLSLPTRLVLAAFLLSVGLGYFSALVQLHFQHAKAGQLLPGPEEAQDNYHGKRGISQLERLITADESKPFNGSGQMSEAFTTKGNIRNIIQARFEDGQGKNIPLAQVEKEVRAEREGERKAMVAWIRSQDREKSFEANSFPLPDELAGQPITDILLVRDENDKLVAPRSVKIQKLMIDRCVRCHGTISGQAKQFPLVTYGAISLYLEPEKTGGGMSLTKLAQTTHVHLLGFSMLFGLTGLIFSFTSYPGLLRGVIGPWTLIAQVADISCWWLGRIDPIFAQAILVTGGLVAIGLLIQILGSLFNMFGKPGKTVVFVLILLACAVGGLAKGTVIDFLAREKAAPAEHR